MVSANKLVINGYFIENWRDGMGLMGGIAVFYIEIDFGALTFK